MALTGKLGTQTSRLANFKLAAGAAQNPSRIVFTAKLGTARSHLATFKLGVTPVFTENVNHTLFFVQVSTDVDTHVTSSTLTFVQTATALHVHNQSITQTLTFSQVATVQRTINQSVHQTLILQSTGHYNAIFNRAASNKLTFQQPIHRNIAGIDVTIMPAMAVLVPSRCMVILRGIGTIVLPCPDLGDTEAYTGGKVILKNSITGQQYTYIRRTANHLIKYTFKMIRDKTLELEVFLQNNLANPIVMTNFKGETWYVVINNNPIDLIGKSRWAPCRERYDVTLEFEGIKITG